MSKKDARNKTTTADEADDLHTAQTEIRHLKGTIAALRESLEAERYGREQAVQMAVAIANDDIAQLKATASALRDQLDAVRHDHEQKVFQLQREARDENKHLQGTIQELRQTLEVAGKPH